MQVVILCGGKGTRMDNEESGIPKPMSLIGFKPIIWHVMNIYSSFGYTDFILCTGFNSHLIHDYFENERFGWKIKCIYTGEDSKKGERLKMIYNEIIGDQFLLSYGDDISDIDINKLIRFHNQKGRMVTLTAVSPKSEFGVLDLNEEGEVLSFKEKPKLEYWINGGFYVMKKEVISKIKCQWDLEKETFEELTKQGEITAFKHEGFWKSVNSQKDVIELNHLWKRKEGPWKN